jgi:hypothetical protein
MVDVAAGPPWPAHAPYPARASTARQLYEIRGPKIVSRLSLVAYDDITPWGDGRLLVHGKGGEVRYVSNLSLPERRPKPAKGQP